MLDVAKCPNYTDSCKLHEYSWQSNILLSSDTECMNSGNMYCGHQLTWLTSKQQRNPSMLRRPSGISLCSYELSVSIPIKPKKATSVLEAIQKANQNITTSWLTLSEHSMCIKSVKKKKKKQIHVCIHYINNVWWQEWNLIYWSVYCLSVHCWRKVFKKAEWGIPLLDLQNIIPDHLICIYTQSHK